MSRLSDTSQALSARTKMAGKLSLCFFYLEFYSVIMVALDTCRTSNRYSGRV